MAKARRSPVNGPGRNKGNLQDWEGPATPATVWFGKTMLQLLRAHAEITQRSFSDIVRDACKNYLATQSGAINHLVEKGE